MQRVKRIIALRYVKYMESAVFAVQCVNTYRDEVIWNWNPCFIKVWNCGVRNSACWSLLGTLVISTKYSLHYQISSRRFAVCELAKDTNSGSWGGVIWTGFVRLCNGGRKKYRWMSTRLRVGRISGVRASFRFGATRSPGVSGCTVCNPHSLLTLLRQVLLDCVTCLVNVTMAGELQM